MGNVDFNVDEVATLAMLKLSDEDKAALAADLPSIVAYISKLHEVDTSNVSAKAYLTDEVNVFRADEVKGCDEEVRKACIEAFPKKTGDALEVPGIFE